MVVRGTIKLEHSRLAGLPPLCGETKGKTLKYMLLRPCKRMATSHNDDAGSPETS